MARTPLPRSHRRVVAPWAFGLFAVAAVLAVGGCGLVDDGDWTPEERESITEFVSGLEHLREGITTLNEASPQNLTESQRQDALEHLELAREQTAGIGDSLLARIHPDLPVYHRSRLQRGIDDRIRALNGAHRYRFASGITRLREWAEWYTRTRDDWNLPRR